MPTSDQLVKAAQASKGGADKLSIMPPGSIGGTQRPVRKPFVRPARPPVAVKPEEPAIGAEKPTEPVSTVVNKPKLAWQTLREAGIEGQGSAAANRAAAAALIPQGNSISIGDEGGDARPFPLPGFRPKPRPMRPAEPMVAPGPGLGGVSTEGPAFQEAMDRAAAEEAANAVGAGATRPPAGIPGFAPGGNPLVPGPGATDTPLPLQMDVMPEPAPMAGPGTVRPPAAVGKLPSVGVGTGTIGAAPPATGSPYGDLAKVGAAAQMRRRPARDAMAGL